MKLTVNSQYLAQYLRALNKVVPSKPVVPVLSHVLFRADVQTGGGEHLSIQATDLEVMMSVTCPATVLEPGVAAMPAATLLSLCERFPDQDVSLTHAACRTMIQSGRFASTLQTLPAGDFPPLPTTEGESVVIDAARLRHLIARTRYAVAASETQRVLRGALLTMSGKFAAMVTTDGKRMSLATVSREEGPEVSFIISAKALDALADISEVGDVTIAVGPRHLFFTLGETLLVVRILNGQFPKYERIIPRSNQLKITVDRLEMLAALQRVTLVAEKENKTIRFTATNGVLHLAAQSADVGNASEELQATYDGEDIEVKANGTHVLDFLSAATEPSVTLSLKDAKAPLLFSDGEGHLGVVASINK